MSVSPETPAQEQIEETYQEPAAADLVTVEVSTEVDSPEASPTPRGAEPSEAHEPDDAEFRVFEEGLKQFTAPEQKLEKALEFMQAALSEHEKPKFKHFWSAKRLCIELFKDCSEPLTRSRLWQIYTHLGKEAKRLKDEQDEESKFAVEQIEVAIAALEADLKALEQEIAAAPDIALDVKSETIGPRWEEYNAIQRKINIFNTHSVRINSLRKELLNTGMRIRFKNQFFQRLSAAGDIVFPPRKDLIQQVSDLFHDDVQQFVDRHFSKDHMRSPLHILRDEIKALQGTAKILTLSTRTFNDTRRCLSQCWDQIRDLDKERRTARQAKKEVFREGQLKVEAKIQDISERFAKGELTVIDAGKEFEGILTFMREVELGRDEIQALRDKLTEARTPVDAVLNAEANERKAKEQERQEALRAQVTLVKGKLASLLTNAATLSVEEIQQQRDEVTQLIKDLQANKHEKQEMERQLKPLRDLILEKREQSLLSLSTDDQEALGSLRKLLQERQQRRKEIKTNMEQLRKAAGASGFDIEQAMRITTQLEEEKIQLQKADEGILEIEQKIRSVEAKV